MQKCSDTHKKTLEQYISNFKIKNKVATNTTAGIIKAKEMLANVGGPNDKKAIILLTDGVPTFGKEIAGKTVWSEISKGR